MGHTIAPPHDDLTHALKHALREVLGAPDYQAREIHFREVPFPSGYPIYLETDDSLMVQVDTVTAVPGIAINLTMLRMDGTLVRSQFSFTPAAAGLSSTTFPVCEGWLVSILVGYASGAQKRGEVLVQVGVQKGSGAAANTSRLFMQDYLAKGEFLSWPVARIIQGIEGPGRIIVQTVTQPAAGAELTFTVPTEARLRINTLFFSLTTSATVANRQIDLIVDDGANTVWRAGVPANQAASLTINYSAGAGVASLTGISGTVAIPLPDQLFLLAAMRVRTSTTGLQAGDQYSAMRLLTEQWVER